MQLCELLLLQLSMTLIVIRNILFLNIYGLNKQEHIMTFTCSSSIEFLLSIHRATKYIFPLQQCNQKFKTLVNKYYFKQYITHITNCAIFIWSATVKIFYEQFNINKNNKNVLFVSEWFLIIFRNLFNHIQYIFSATVSRRRASIANGIAILVRMTSANPTAHVTRTVDQLKNHNASTGSHRTNDKKQYTKFLEWHCVVICTHLNNVC